MNPCLDCGCVDVHVRGYCQPCYRRRQVRGEFEFEPFVDVSWHQDAPCAYVDPELWFPDKGESTKAAKAICRRCPVRAECLDYALTWHQRFGVWGGLRERRALHGLVDDVEDVAA